MKTPSSPRGKHQNPRKSVLGKGIQSLLGAMEGEEEASSETDSAESDIESKRVGTKAHPAEREDRKQGQEVGIEQFTENNRVVIDIPPQKIDPNPHQPRKVFLESKIDALAKSIEAAGIIQPLVVNHNHVSGRYTLIAGERRLRAAKKIGLKKVPVIIEGYADRDLLRLALIENIQRSDLNVIEEAQAYLKLIDDLQLTQQQCADKVGKERVTVSNTLRILKLPTEVQEDLMEERLSMGHGRALLSLEDKKLILRARDLVIKKKMSVRQTEQLCKTFRESGGAAPRPQAESSCPDMSYVADKLRSQLKTKVRLAGSKTRGKIEISYFSAAELERITSLISPNHLL